ncbi:phosphoribosylanthranilate isomerase [Lewinella sp. 4G2]|uniref:phosphoribosylanthranilate isomerase n=1 Tax=Lewinella sp. 4G2 TaxID=1803372 RepID=UPI0007B46D31|nr:phosphoribosylanthranilate isomerase [Lewinella sp. 4G2]OAV46044.1 phosphoribosylanthranilate isomerase [Lewinella sp. 4G2]
MKVKVCGLTTPDNLTEATTLGVDFVGMIFYDKSPRYVDNPELKKWLEENASLFTGTKKVGVFVNAEVDYVLNAVHDYQLDYVQLHGDESAGYCSELKLLWSVNTLRSARVIKAFRITEDFDFNQTAPYTGSADLFVFDTGGHQDHGGTGEQWNWDLLANYTGPTSFLLSGGIGPKDLEKLRKLDHPQFVGVDINSKFETRPGVKDMEVVAKFVKGLHAEQNT